MKKYIVIPVVVLLAILLITGCSSGYLPQGVYKGPAYKLILRQDGSFSLTSEYPTLVPIDGTYKVSGDYVILYDRNDKRIDRFKIEETDEGIRLRSSTGKLYLRSLD